MRAFLISLFIGFSLSAVSQDNFESLGILPDAVMETSGLVLLNGNLITHNDSGNSAVLFELDTTSLSVARTVTIDNAVNTDWEDLAQDEDYIYIGDFGNNTGVRTDLKIYRIAKQDYLTQDLVTAEAIDFNYIDQTDFSGGQNSDFDAEAMVVFEDVLLIFTKQWQSNGTVVYSIPKIPGAYTATPLTTYDTNGLVTGATFDAENRILLLCGYSQQLQPFVISTTGISTAFEFNASTTRSDLPVGFAQVEGIAHSGSGRYFLSSEKFVNANPPITLDPTVFAFNFGGPPPPPPPPDPDPDPDPPPSEEPYTEGVTLFRPQGSSAISYDLFGDRQLFGRAVFDTSGRLIQYIRVQDIEVPEVELSGLGSGVYYLTFYLRGLTISEPFIVK